MKIYLYDVITLNIPIRVALICYVLIFKICKSNNASTLLIHPYC